MRQTLRLIERGLMVLATLGMLLMMFFISVDALGRHLFNHPLPGIYEITSLFFMVVLVFATLSANYADDRHVRVDILSARLKERLGRNYPRLIALICLPVFLFLAWHACAEGLFKFRRLESQMGRVPLPLYLSYVWVAIGAVTISLRFILDLFVPEDPRVRSNRPGDTAA